MIQCPGGLETGMNHPSLLNFLGLESPHAPTFDVSSRAEAIPVRNGAKWSSETQTDMGK